MGFIYFRTYNSDGTVDTQHYGIQGGDANGDVSETMPMLSIYYYFMGLYAIYISDTSDSSITSTSEDEEENYQSTSNKTSDQGNSFLSKFRVHATIYIDVK